MGSSEPHLSHAWLLGLVLISAYHLIFWLPQCYTKGGTVFVQTDGVPEDLDGVVRSKGQCVRNEDSDSCYRVPVW